MRSATAPPPPTTRPERIPAPRIRDLAVIGDRRTAALVARDGGIPWYCPGRFDRPSVFARLLDACGGGWSIELPESRPLDRGYIGASGVLETRLRAPSGAFTITDWMPAGEGAAAGVLCRLFSAAPAAMQSRIAPRPDYARAAVRLARRADGAVSVNAHLAAHASHALAIDGDDIVFSLPRGEAGWMVLAPADLRAPTGRDLERWLAATLAYWRRLASRACYSGPYQQQVENSLRAIRLLAHEESGGIVAAATTSLPEVRGGARNWDYRYVWLRDTGMIVSALTRLGGGLEEGKAYLDFICRSRGSSREYPVAVFATLDGEAAPREECLDFAGYLGSRPVRIGNDAGSQMQLDAFSNVLLAAKLIYERDDERPHWETIAAVADFLAAHWSEPDHGLWEEPARKQYTAGKVITACALSTVAEFSPDGQQAARWRRAVAETRDYVAHRCLNKEGAYAAVAGGEAVDISAALFPVWAYTAADTPAMKATIAALERECQMESGLFRRHLECADSSEDGAFLAGSLWVAQYWVMRGELGRARRLINSALACANDVGLFAEEADPEAPRLLGNFPQAFAHAALIGAVIDLKAAEA